MRVVWTPDQQIPPPAEVHSEARAGGKDGIDATAVGA
jgi:hypothetical protein